MPRQSLLIGALMIFIVIIAYRKGMAFNNVDKAFVALFVIGAALSLVFKPIEAIRQGTGIDVPMMQKSGVPEAQTIGMNKGSEPIEIGGVKVALTHAEHSGNEVGFVIEVDGKRIYHAGDTALFGDMKYIGELYSPDVAMLPIGGYFTMAPKEAAIAADLIGAKINFPMHYSTFQQIEQDPQKFAGMVKKSKVVVLKIGEEYTL